MKQIHLAGMFFGLTVFGVLLVPIANAIFAAKFEEASVKPFSIDNFLGVRNIIALQKFGRSLDEKHVIVGKDGFLFLGNSHAAVLDKSRGLYKVNNVQIETWVNRLKSLQNWFENQGIKFQVVIAPNKHTVYSEKLPDTVKYSEGNTITDRLVDVSKVKGVHVLNLKDSLRARKTKTLYFRTDTHWNRLGATLAFEQTIEHLNRFVNTNYILPNYTFTRSSRRRGDLTRLLKMRRFLPLKNDTNFRLELETVNEVCLGKIDQNQKLQKCAFVPNPIMAISKNDLYMINGFSTNGDKLLLLADSFSTSNSRVFNATFATVWKFHHSRLNGKALANFVSKNKPDIVIYQIVERDLIEKDFGVDLE